MASVLVFDVSAFRTQVPVYADPTAYPDSMLQEFWDMSIEFISDSNYGWLIDKGRRMAINWMLAHLLYISNLITMGTTPSIVTSSTVDKTSVTLQPPKETDKWAYWLNMSPYGQALMALLSARAVGGLFAGSQFPRAGIRQPDGNFL